MSFTNKNLKIAELDVNRGQIAGLPKNPRFIRDERFNALKKSIEDAPEMLSLRELLVYPFEGKYVVIGGNMRLRACKDLGYMEVPCKVLDESTPVLKLREYSIKDNEAFGQNDWDILANEWDMEELQDWGMELENFGIGGNQDETGEDDVDVDKLIETASSESLLKEYSEDTNYDMSKFYREKVNPEILSQIEKGIKEGTIREEIAGILKTRADQCSIFNFDEIIKYYRSDDATETEKELLKRLYLVFVAPKELVEKGFLKIRDTTLEIFDDEITRKLNEENGSDDDEEE